jgi:prevent-host-death family protein
MDRIGVRELRQNASRYLKRVESGETIEVTDRGRPVARLVPIQLQGYARLAAEGRIRLGDGGDILDMTPPSELVSRMRDE